MKVKSKRAERELLVDDLHTTMGSVPAGASFDDSSELSKHWIGYWTNNYIHMIIGVLTRPWSLCIELFNVVNIDW